MKKTYLISFFLMLLCVQTKAQKFLDIYQNGNITTSVSPSDLDSISVTGDTPENRRVNFYRDGNTVNSFLASEVDSIKVFRSDEEPLVYLGIVGFNQELYEKPIDVLASNNYNIYTEFVNNLPSKDGTLLYYAVDHALDMIEAYNFDTQINSVNLITFTDGLDQGSLMLNSNYSTEVQYLNAVSNRIKNLNVKGMPLTAYSIGLRGSDVSDYTMFQNNLNKLASSSDKAFEANNMSEVSSRLQSISDQLISVSNKQNVSVKIPGLSNGTVIRFTFDGYSAENSTLYIQGTFNLASRSLTNITYHGIKSTSGNVVQGTQDGIFVTFTFSGLQREDGNGLIPMYSIQEYYKSVGSSEWQRNSEFSPENNTLTTVTHSGSAILLVLDCSSSLGSRFGDMKSYASNFIGRVANNTTPYSVDAPTGVTAVIPDDDFIVRVSWNAVKHAESYEVYRSSYSYYGFAKVAEGVTSTTWDDSTPIVGYNYYLVSAVGHGLTSPESNTTTGVNYALEPPKNVTATIQEEDFTINVSWDAVTHAESYDVYRSSSSSSGFTKVASGITATTWNDATPLAGNNYYRVYAVGHGLTSPASNTTTGVNYALEVPQNVTAIIPDDVFVVRVTWDAVSHAESYDVYRSSSSSSGFTKVASGITATTWNDATPLAGNNYYRVYAVGHGLTSPASNTTTVVNYALEAPQNVVATYDENNVGIIIVSWNPVPHAETYDVYKDGTLFAEDVSTTSVTDNTPGLGYKSYYVKAKSQHLESESSNTAYIFAHANDATKVTVNGVDIYMVKVSGGTFQMGATSEQGSDTDSDEKPVHQVTLSDYYIGETEVTQELWQAVMGSNPSYFTSSPQLPVEKVSWNDCQTFITRLNELTGKQFRLPTEAEWEYAARGGNKSNGYKYSGSNDIGVVAWYSGNSASTTHNVGTKAPNELGLFDMTGNVSEWCQDWFGSYSSSAQTNPTGPSWGYSRVKRGCSWRNNATYCPVSYRYYDRPGSSSDSLGLRLAL